MARIDSLGQFSVRTTSGRYFSGEEHALLAHLILTRFGDNVHAAANAWRKMLENNCEDSAFAELAYLGGPLHRSTFK